MSNLGAATRVSVIMPVYDRAGYVRASVESVLSTRYPALEVLVVDDGSTDGTGPILEDLRARNEAVVRVLRHPGGRNAGPWASRNLALAEATGAYVCFLDSDDLMLPHRFERAVRILDEDPGLDGVVEVAELMFDSEETLARWGKRALRYGPRVAAIPADGFLAACLIERVCSMHTSNILVRARLFERAGLFRTPGGRSEDYHLWLRLAGCGRFAVGETARPITLYRRHAGNIWTPDPMDSVRDAAVLADVLAWARRSPQVSRSSRAVLLQAYRNKLRWCVRMLRASDRKRALRFVAGVFLRGHRPALDPRLVADLARIVLRRPQPARRAGLHRG
jgi:glycosyltransferase involved in cell wall biosynthesis